MSHYVGDRLVCRYGWNQFHPYLRTRRSPTESDIPDIILIQLILPMMSPGVLETCRELE